MSPASTSARTTPSAARVRTSKSASAGTRETACSLAMGVFVYVIAVLFSISESWDPARPLADPSSFPTSVFPSALLIALAMVMGWLLYKRKFPLLPTTAVGFVLMMGGVWGGLRWPLLWMDRASWPGQAGWILILLAYSFIASVLPVWSLLQARPGARRAAGGGGQARLRRAARGRA